MPLAVPLCGVEEMSARLGLTLTGVEQQRALAALQDASALVRSVAEADFLDDHGELEAPIPDVVVQVTLAAALRAYRNPDGVQRAQTADVSVTYRAEGAGDAIFLTTQERRSIRRAMGIGGVVSVPLESAYPPYRDPLYAPVQDGGDDIPLGPAPWGP